MLDGLGEAADPVHEAIGVRSEVFSSLVKRVTTLMMKEEVRVGSLRVQGRLVHLPSLREATIVGDLHKDLDSLLTDLCAKQRLSKV